MYCHPDHNEQATHQRSDIRQVTRMHQAGHEDTSPLCALTSVERSGLADATVTTDVFFGSDV